MNTRIKIIIAAALMLLAACQVEEQKVLVENAFELEPEEMVAAPDITASQESGTKTILEVDGEGVGTIYWKPEDEINVFYGSTSTHYVSQNAANATIALFTTTDVIGINEGAATNVWGLYPYNSSATCTGSAVTTTLPATQYGVPGTFDDDLFITLAHNNSTELSFYNVCGGIKFSLSRDDITSITFRGNNNEDIAGDITLDFVNDLPRISVTAGLKEITLTPKTGDTFASGEYYYLVLLPATLTGGFTMVFETNTQIGRLNYNTNAITIKRSIFGTKDDINEYASFMNRPTNLSEAGTANCYIIPEAGTYKFAAVKGNSNTPVGDVRGVKVMWESYGNISPIEVGDIINPEVTYVDGEIIFSTNEIYREGNAVIAAFSDEGCSDGNALWSWHLWLTPANIDALCQTYNNNVGLMMDRNLGAQNNNSGYQFGNQGLLYQWGRKDPFLAGWYTGSNNNDDILTEATSSTNWPTPVSRDASTGVAYSVAHPMTFIKNAGDWMYGDAELLSSRWGIEKTIYDPCPPGYKVPEVDTWIIAYGRNDDLYNFYSYYRGSSYSAGRLANSEVWYPAGYLRNGQTGAYERFADRVNVYWASNPPTGNAEQPAYGPGMVMTSYDRLVYLCVSQAFGLRPQCNYKSVGAMIRCAKETNPPVVRAESVNVNASSIRLVPGGQTQLSATVCPANANITTFRWTSDNTSVATVGNDGTVNGVSIGKTNIRVGSSYWQSGNLSYYSGSSVCEVNVCPDEPCNGPYGGWYISARSGGTISFIIHVGDNDGYSDYDLYLGDEHLQGGSYEYKDIEFSYTFSSAFTGWLYFHWLWTFSVRSITTSNIQVLGRGMNNNEFYDTWAVTPSYRFEYRNGVLTMN